MAGTFSEELEKILAEMNQSRTNFANKTKETWNKRLNNEISKEERESNYNTLMLQNKEKLTELMHRGIQIISSHRSDLDEELKKTVKEIGPLTEDTKNNIGEEKSKHISNLDFSLQMINVMEQAFMRMNEIDVALMTNPDDKLFEELTGLEANMKKGASIVTECEGKIKQYIAKNSISERTIEDQVNNDTMQSIHSVIESSGNTNLWRKSFEDMLGNVQRQLETLEMIKERMNGDETYNTHKQKLEDARDDLQRYLNNTAIDFSLIDENTKPTIEQGLKNIDRDVKSAVEYVDNLIEKFKQESSTENVEQSPNEEQLSSTRNIEEEIRNTLARVGDSKKTIKNADLQADIEVLAHLNKFSTGISGKNLTDYAASLVDSINERMDNSEAELTQADKKEFENLLSRAKEIMDKTSAEVNNADVNKVNDPNYFARLEILTQMHDKAEACKNRLDEYLEHENLVRNRKENNSEAYTEMYDSFAGLSKEQRIANMREILGNIEHNIGNNLEPVQSNGVRQNDSLNSITETDTVPRGVETNHHTNYSYKKTIKNVFRKIKKASISPFKKCLNMGKKQGT